MRPRNGNPLEALSLPDGATVRPEPIKRPRPTGKPAAASILTEGSLNDSRNRKQLTPSREKILTKRSLSPLPGTDSSGQLFGVNFLHVFGGIIKALFMARVHREHPTPKENLIKKIGGKLEGDYFSLRAAVDEVNGKYFPLLCYFGLNRSDDAENVTIALSNGVAGINNYFVERTKKDIEEGKLKKEKVLKAKWIVDENTPPEEREKRLRKEATELRRSLNVKFKMALKAYGKEYSIDYYGIGNYYKNILSLSRNLLYVTDYGMEIDVEKFISFYKDRMAASESIVGSLHEEAATALNKFFGGAVPITEKELNRYFDFKTGIAIVRPESVSLESYSRLGIRIVNVKK